MDLPTKNVPIIGQKNRDERGIQILRAVLQKLEAGELCSVALVAENTEEGTMLIALSEGGGEMMRMVGALRVLQRKAEDQIVVKHGDVEAPPAGAGRG